MWTLQNLTARDDATEIENAAFALAQAARRFSADQSWANLEAVLETLDRADNVFVAVEKVLVIPQEAGADDSLGLIMRLIEAYGRRLTPRTRADEAASPEERSRREMYAVNFQAAVELLLRELEALERTSVG